MKKKGNTPEGSDDDKDPKKDDSSSNKSKLVAKAKKKDDSSSSDSEEGNDPLKTPERKFKPLKSMKAPDYTKGDSTDEEEYKKVEKYDPMKKLKEIKTKNASVKDLSFISHAIGLEYLYSRKVHSVYSRLKKDHLTTRNYHINREFRLEDFASKSAIPDLEVLSISQSSAEASSTKEHDNKFGYAVATKFINRNAKRAISDYPNNQGSLVDTPERWNRNYELTFSHIKGHKSKSNHLIYKKDQPNRLDNGKTTYTRGHTVKTGIGYEYYSEYSGFLGSIPNSGVIMRELSIGTYSEELAKLDPDTQNKLIALSDLFFSCETSKNPAAHIHHQMLLDLVIDHGMTWGEALSIMPISVKDTLMRNRAINEKFEDYMPIPYHYDYRESTQEGKDGESELADREVALVQKWLDAVHPGTDLNSIKIITRLIREAVNGWYGVDLDELLYTEDDMGSLLNHYLPAERGFFVAPQTQFEHQGLLQANIEQAIGEVTAGNIAVLPINIHYNHWTGIVIRRQANGTIQVIYVDPLGGSIGDEPNLELFIDHINGLAPGSDIIDLGAGGFTQQSNNYDCGPFTVANLIALATTDIDLDGLDAEGIIELGILAQPADGNADELRDEYDLVLHPAPPPVAVAETKDNKDSEGSTTVGFVINVNYDNVDVYKDLFSLKAEKNDLNFLKFQEDRLMKDIEFTHIVPMPSLESMQIMVVPTELAGFTTECISGMICKLYDLLF